jgi:hypothetical protein
MKNKDIKLLSSLNVLFRKYQILLKVSFDVPVPVNVNRVMLMVLLQNVVQLPSVTMVTLMTTIQMTALIDALRVHLFLIEIVRTAMG